MMPGKEDHAFEDLIAGTLKGLALLGAGVQLDFQCLNGLGQGTVYEIRDGRRVAKIAGAGFLFRVPELWRGLDLIGGPTSARWFGTSAAKGEPMQTSGFSVSAVPARVKQVTIIETVRKA
jgi:hypothetical protein